MKNLMVEIAASLVVMAFVVVVVSSWEPAGFAIGVTIREIARVNLPHLGLQVGSLVLSTVLVGHAVKALSAHSVGSPPWRQRWL